MIYSFIAGKNQIVARSHRLVILVARGKKSDCGLITHIDHTSRTLEQLAAAIIKASESTQQIEQSSSSDGTGSVVVQVQQ